MLPVDKGIRNLLPFLDTEPEDIALLDLEFDGSPAVASDVPSLQGPPASSSADGRIPTEDRDEEGAAAFIINGLGQHHSASYAADLAVSGFVHAQVSAPFPDSDAEVTRAHVALRRLKIDHDSQRTDTRGGQTSKKGDNDDDDGTITRHGPGKEGHVGPGRDGETEEQVGTGEQVGTAGDGVSEEDRGHTISVSQVADVDQDAAIFVHGYAGKVVARLHIDQDLMMDQDVEIFLALDSDDHFDVLVDQDMRIDQDISIDLEIFDVDGVLYVDLFLADRIEVEQDARLHVQIGDGQPGGTVRIDQDIDLVQEVDVDVDIEDDLEERYVVKVDVDVQQDVEVEQDATVSITDRAGELDVDIDALQTALVDQDTVVRIDLAQV